MNLSNDKTEHFFIAYNEGLIRTNKKTGEQETLIRDFRHVVIGGREFVDYGEKLVPYSRKNFPFSIYDIDFTKLIDNEILMADGREKLYKTVLHIQIKGVEYVLLNGKYLEYGALSVSYGQSAKNKKRIGIAAGLIMVIIIAAIVSAFAGTPNLQERNNEQEIINLNGTGCATYTTITEPIPEPTIPGYFEKEYTWWYDDRADRFLWSNSNSGRTWTITIPVSKNSYYHSKEADHSSRIFSTYVNDSLNQETMKFIADEIFAMGKEYGFGDFENAMNAASFVQDGLAYTEDEVTTGSIDYWRYPVETLVDGGGDCEDSAILLASILQNMGYEVIVIGLPGHAAVAIKDVINPVCGNYAQIVYNGEKYLFLESTNTSEIGSIPYEYYNEMALEGFV